MDPPCAGRNLTAMLRRWAPYAVAIAGSVVITAVIAGIQAYTSVAGLSALYLLVVLYAGARWGRWPAVAASVAAFALYDFFLVPPVGTFNVRGVSELLQLIVLLAVALVTGQLAAAQRRSQAESNMLAAQTRALYELATAALKSSEAAAALSIVAGRAKGIPGVERFTVAAVDHGQTEVLAGGELTADDVKQVMWSHESGRPVGVSVSDGVVTPVRTRPKPGGPAYLPLTSGAVVLAVADEDPDPSDMRMLAALVALAGLLLDRRRAAIEAERARGFEASDRLKAAVLASISHELKSPIASLRAGLTALVAPGAGLEPEQHALVLDMDRQATRLDRMVGEMLVLSRLEAGLPLDREAHGFSELVGTALRQLRTTDFKDRRVEVDVSGDLPEVEVDEVQVGRVLVNLLENAVEWAPPDGGIAIGAALRENHLEAWVENDGPPIPTVDLERIFDTFWTRRAGGSGLGLAICKRIVEAHGGTIRAENMRRGPRFTFTLPLVRVHATT
jgi:two-component system, OmpR family, sensor histidine kinase KdpD